MAASGSGKRSISGWRGFRNCGFYEFAKLSYEFSGFIVGERYNITALHAKQPLLYCLNFLKNYCFTRPCNGIRFIEQRGFLKSPSQYGIMVLQPTRPSNFLITSFAFWNKAVKKIVAQPAQYHQMFLGGLVNILRIPNVVRVIKNRFFTANLAFPLFTNQSFKACIAPFLRFEIFESVMMFGCNTHAGHDYQQFYTGVN